MAEYKQHVSQREYNPTITQSGFNPPAPVNDINSKYQRKRAIANEIINIGKTGSGAFGLAHQRSEEEEELTRIAEDKIDRENLIKAELEGKALAAGGGEYNESTAIDLIKRSIKYRTGNPELVKKLNIGFLLKTGELTVAETNANIKANSEVAVKHLGMAWIKKQKEALLVRGRVETIKDFPDFVAEYIDVQALKIKEKLIKDNRLIDEVLAQDGKRLNYDPLITEASKWYKDYKDREKEKAINHSLSLHAWADTNGHEYFKIIRPRIMKFNNIQTKQKADLEVIGYLQGELLNKIANGISINDPLLENIPKLLSYKHPNNVSLLDAGGEYNVGGKSQELLALVQSTQKRLNDSRDAISKDEKNRAEEERKERLQLAFTSVYAQFQDDLRLAKTPNEINVIVNNYRRDYIDVPYEENITLEGTLGGGSSKELLNKAAAMYKELKLAEKEGQKPRVLTPDELKLKTDAEFKIGEINKRVTEIQNYQLEEKSIEDVEGILKSLKYIYEEVINGSGTPQSPAGIASPSEGLGTDWKDWNDFYKLYNTAWGNVKKQKTELIKRINEANTKSNLQTASYRLHSKKAKNKATNKKLEASIVDSMHDGLKEFLKLPPESRSDTMLDNIEKSLDFNVTEMTISNDGLYLVENKVPLFDGQKHDEYRRLIATRREMHNREVADKTKVSPIVTAPDLYDEINKEIDSLRGVPAYLLYSARFGKKPGRVSELKKKLSENLINKKLSTPHFNHFEGLLTKLSSNVDKTLDETYGSKSVYDKAYSSLRLSIIGSTEEGILIPSIAESKSSLLNESTEDLLRFEETMVKRYPSIFSDTNMYNYDIRRGIFSAYVEWLKGKQTTDNILQSYIGIRKYTGEEEPRFTKYERKVFEDSIPKDESPYKDRFEDLSIKVKTGTGTEGDKKEENQGAQGSTTNNEKRIEELVIQAAKHGVPLSRNEVKLHLEQGLIPTYVESGDHVMERIWIKSTDIQSDTTITDETLGNSLFE